eukprot:7965701-Karenia_brevis.AAC.1
MRPGLLRLRSTKILMFLPIMNIILTFPLLVLRFILILILFFLLLIADPSHYAPAGMAQRRSFGSDIECQTELSVPGSHFKSMVLQYAADVLPLRLEHHVEPDTLAGLYDVSKIGRDFERLRRINTTDPRPGVPLGD